MGSKKYTLVVSTGNSDIKLWVTCKDDQGKEYFASVEPDEWAYKESYVRELHQRLAENSILYKLLTRHEAADRKLLNGEELKLRKLRLMINSDGKVVFPSEVSYKVGASSININSIRCIEADGKICLHPAKMERIIPALSTLHNGTEKKFVLTGALFLNSQRNEKRIAEPVSGHIILAQWLAGLCGVSAAPLSEMPEENERIFFANYAQDLIGTADDNIEGKGKNFPLKRVVARRLDDHIRIFLSLDHNCQSICLVSHTGGFGEIKQVITNSVNLRNPHKQYLEINDTEHSSSFATPEGAIQFIESHVDKHHPHPSVSLAIRALVEDRIIRGDFSGAWSVCAHLQDVAPEKYWVQAVKWSYDYFSHNWKFDVHKDTPCFLRPLLQGFKSKLNYLSTDDGQLLQQIINVLTLSCFRIEAALTTNNQRDAFSDIRLEEAIVLTCSLADQLLRAEVWLWVEKNYGRLSFDQTKIVEVCRDVNVEGPHETSVACLLRFLASFFQLSAGTNVKSVERIIKNKKVIFDHKTYSLWRNKLKQGTREPLLEEDYRGRLEIRIQGKAPASFSRIRNLVAHHVVDKKAQSLAFDFACADKWIKKQDNAIEPLWNRELLPISKRQAKGNTVKIAAGDAFLSQYWVRQLEKRFDITSPLQKKYSELVNSLLEIIRMPIIE